MQDFGHIDGPRFVRREDGSVGDARAKLTDDDVRAMRRMYDVDLATASQVQAAYPHVSLQHVVGIVDRRRRVNVKNNV